MRTLGCFALLSLSLRATPPATPVHVWQGSITLPTSQEGLPDPNPPFDLFATTRFNYPYTIRENLTGSEEAETWRAVFLENEYLKCEILPDIGGHVYTCLDKLSGKPMFYANPSIKKAEIGYRGAWAAFGIEFNFPVSHNWVSMSPVEFAYRQHADGSASVVVGNIDRVYGMQWSVELILRPGSTVLEEQITLNNRSDVRHRFYWWNNAAVEVWNDSRVDYPMYVAASHGFTEVQPWPVDKDGTDLSTIANQTKGPVSLFVHGSREPFMGVWNPHTNTGTVHFADSAELPGKKIWSWGVDADGLDWRKALSDNESAYVEIQGGLFRNQETYAFLEPRRTIRFSEYWMPVRDIGGITRANLAGVLHLTRLGERLLVGCNVNSRIPKARIAIANGRQTIFSESVDLSPEDVWQKRIDHAAAAAHYTMTIADANGNVLLRQKEGEFDWTPASEVHIGPQTGYQFPPPSERTEGDWLQVGTVQEQNGGVLNVIDSYGQALRLFPHSYALLKAHGRAAASFGRFEEAEHSLAAAAKRDTVDPEVHYYLGISEEALGKLREARLSFEAAYRFPEFRAAAALRLGEMMARNGDADLASRYLREAAKLLPDDQRATEEWLLFRPPTSEVRNALVRFPLSDALREALGSPDLAALAGDADRVIEVAILYMRLGHYQNAAKVLSRAYPAIPEAQHEPGSVLPQDHALVRYLRAYCNLKLGKDDVAMEFRKASDASLLYIFPNRPEVLPALQEALRINSSDASAEFLIGTYLFQLGEIDAGISHWQRARQLRPAIPALHADIGNALLHVNQDFDGALAAFEEGTRFDPDNAALYTGMEQALSLLHRPPADRVHDLERYPLNREMPANLAFELALNRSETGDIERAEALFRGRFFPRREGGTNVRQVWLEVELQKSLQLAQKHDCPSAIGAADALGKPVAGLDFTNDGLDAFLRPARTQFLLGLVHEQCHDDTNARTHFEKASAQLDPAQIFWAYRASQKLASDTMAWPAALSGALEQAQKNERTSSNPGWWIYNQALLKMALGDSEHAKTDFGRALLAPDNALSYHLVRLAESGVIPE